MTSSVTTADISCASACKADMRFSIKSHQGIRLLAFLALEDSTQPGMFLQSALPCIFSPLASAASILSLNHHSFKSLHRNACISAIVVADT